MAKLIQFGKVYYDEMIKVYYVVIAYHDVVPGMPFNMKDVYEVVKLHEPDKKTYAAVKTVESWVLVNDKGTS